jgi:hypothetical protein
MRLAQGHQKARSTFPSGLSASHPYIISVLWSLVTNGGCRQHGHFWSDTVLINHPNSASSDMYGEELLQQLGCALTEGS